MDKEKRVYIGSRYVPLIMGAWDINTEYEGLSIVIDEKNNSYTSKGGVPIGIELTNTDYWVMTGSYEGVMLEIEKKLNGRIDKCKADLALLEELHGKDIKGIEEKITIVELSIESLSSTIKDLGEKIAQTNVTHREDVKTINERLVKLENEIEEINNTIKEVNEGTTELSNRVTTEVKRLDGEIAEAKKEMSAFVPTSKTINDSSGKPKLVIPIGDGIYIIDVMVKLKSGKGLILIRQKLVVTGDTHTSGEKGVPLTHGTEYSKINMTTVTYINSELICEATVEGQEPVTMTVNTTKLMEV